MNRWLAARNRNAALVLVAGLVFVVVAVVYGLSVFDRLKTGGFIDPKSSSVQAADLIQQKFPSQEVDALVLFETGDKTVAESTAALDARIAALKATPGVSSVKSYHDNPIFIAQDGHSTYAAVTFDPKADPEDTLAAVEKSQQTFSDGITAKFGGALKVNDEVTAQVKKDISRAEEISFPLLLILLIVIFRGLIAALLPLLLGVIAILGAFLVVKGLTYTSDISVFAINIITLLGLGLAIDYSLFIVSRFREELAAGHDSGEAISRTMQTAGRAVLFSGVTVAICMLSLLVFPQSFFRSMGLGGASAVMVAVIAALTILPAILRLLGHRINWLSFRRTKPARAEDAGFWYRWGKFVMRHPLIIGGLALELLVIASLPFLHANFTNVTIDTLPTTFESRQVHDALVNNFVGTPLPSVDVVVVNATPSDLATFTKKLHEVPGVAGLTSKTVGDSTLIEVYYNGQTLTLDSQRLVTAIRAVPVPFGARVETGGIAAALVDQIASQANKLPEALALIAITTSILLFIMMGSFVIPVKAIILNIISLSAAFGILVWLFQEGHLTAPLHFTSTGAIDVTMPILVFAIAFGLAMDYEVFLLSRIKEYYDKTGDNVEAIAHGLQKTGGIITSAALLLVVVIGAFSLSNITVIKQVGVGLAIAVLVDATIVRSVLVPAAMRILGKANWWAPKPLQRLVSKLELE